ncbi:hypothetical protein IB270_27885 [Ensifer sp. ENS05]|uniref:hypothetical protein n=1 Tax=Ensifer sp. ENS05 TaxID=2769277 RepID=UPI001783F9A0|nr:hypothetical protein [Ensifer sp. ENS05]MBD9596653.1 hypothetical protein [Ensifer sp. ENS05]
MRTAASRSASNCPSSGTPMPTLPRLKSHGVPLPAAALSFAASPDGHTPKISAHRLRTWDIASTFHCSIIGTCLTAGELRQVLIRTGQDDVRTATDHTLHGRGVWLAGQRDQAAKLLNKALDKRHESSIKRIPRQADQDELRNIWRNSFERGDIAGPYWALMSHPGTSPALMREIFGEVHMLSHLVGSASRLDIARLTELERELEQERERTARQETRLKAAADERIALQQRLRSDPRRSNRRVGRTLGAHCKKHEGSIRKQRSGRDAQRGLRPAPCRV